MLRGALDEYCREQKVAKRGLLRGSIAERIIMLFESGLTDPAAIVAALMTSDDKT